ncbi:MULTISPECIES: LLM class F420-dependent oxidoreductase [unclassified Nocardioides]|uniref:LLM class F420-dependent oxidoreductase n=1 Tax=unclassified Nocardioides TaxID=2615069 RepID=UPI0006FC0608|nr:MULTISPECIES: LLM class F420-dependent oxidoreductase [unclassified Nocardioides]KRA37716.1 LLM class F420-dependent oxidoreductase [Nocardioides sp. Root614]KRA91676.1 LLM class F420-dependent oxidoreductase [Nocardioides sp. Root682]
MKLGMIMDYTGSFDESVELIQAYEQVGLEMVAIPEAYSFDAVSQLGYVAAKTQKVELMTAILQVYSRTPSLTAMTAAGLDFVSGGRFTLGLGASGPQVVEGFHGLKYDAPLGRTREAVEICRQVWRREPLSYDGKYYRAPLTKEHGGSGLGKPLKIINRPLRADIPVSIAALGLKNVELVAEISQGWQPLFFHPLKAQQAWGESLAAGFAKRDPALGELDIQLQVSFHVGEPTPEITATVRNQLALYIGGMGARDKNFYNQLACRYGYEAEAKEIQDLYLSGDKVAAAAAVPQDLVEAVTLMGDDDSLRRQLGEFHDAGVRTLLVNPMAATPADRVEHVGRLSELLAERHSPVAVS